MTNAETVDSDLMDESIEAILDNNSGLWWAHRDGAHGSGATIDDAIIDMWSEEARFNDRINQEIANA
jgi:hypothetical protein